MAKSSKSDRNRDSALFRQLTRLLSGPVVGFRRQHYRKLRKRKLDNYKAIIRSSSGQEFKQSRYSAYDSILGADFYAQQNRAERYVDFDQMEFTPEIASSLDIYADEMTTSSELSPLLTINCTNQEIKSVLEILYHNILNIKFNLFGWARTMCKYGDFFLYLDIDEEVGVKNAMGLPLTELERLEGEDKSNPNYVQYQWNTAGLTLENWQIAHFRILGNDKHAPYGTSVLDSARRIWRQLTLLEDAVMAYRIVRSPERRVFYIDVGNIPPEDIEQYVQKVTTQMKRNQVIDVDTGRVDLRYNPLSIEEDYFIPVRGDTNSRIESLPGGSYTGDIDDIKYLRDKLFSALKVPASYLSRAEGADEDKTTLAQKDIRFARTIQRLQRSLVSELEKIGIIHLFTLGYRGNDLVNFNLALNNPSRLAELQELEHWQTKFTAASAATEGFFSRQWISDRIFGLSTEEFERTQREMFYDRKHDAALERVAEDAAAATGGGGGDLGALGGDEPAGGEETFTDEEVAGAPDAPAEPAAEAGEEPPPGGGADDVLLARPPGKRDVDRSKGKVYKPVKVDKRRQGARKRHEMSKFSRETASDTLRNTFPGYGEIRTLQRGISEQVGSNYDLEEELIFKVGAENKVLIEGLLDKGTQKNEEEAQ